MILTFFCSCIGSARQYFTERFFSCVSMSPFGLSKGADHPLMPGMIWYSSTSANSNLPSHFGCKTLVIKHIQGLGLPHQTTRGSRLSAVESRGYQLILLKQNALWVLDRHLEESEDPEEDCAGHDNTPLVGKACKEAGWRGHGRRRSP